MGDEIGEIRAKIQAIDAGMDAVLGEIQESMSLGHDAKPLCNKLCPLVHVKEELIHLLSHLVAQNLVSLFPTDGPLQGHPVPPEGWPTRSWRSEPWHCSSSDALPCP